MRTTDPVTLDNCAREPIHIPGAIQAHGCLLAFDAGLVLAWRSQNAASLLGDVVPAVGAPLDASRGPAAAHIAEAVERVLAAGPDATGMPFQSELQLGETVIDLIVHHNGRHAIAECEPRLPGGIEPAAFSVMAHTSLARIRQRRSVNELLQLAVTEMRQLTGFDRVMAYVFRHDASGDIVAEARRDDLEPFLHRRYPASDIPAQARRLYVVNTLRLIADVGAKPVPVDGVATEPLDLSWSTLRSVSPIHIEYLTNMGVGASMSVSIVVGGELWGMLACHHQGPRVVPYAVRMACDVLGHVLASQVQTLLAADRARRMAEGARMRLRLIESVMLADSVLDAVKADATDVAACFHAEGLVATAGTETFLHGNVDAGFATELVQWLQSAAAADGLLATSMLAELPPALAGWAHPWCGVLAIRSDPIAATSWIVLLRREQVETVRWGGRPEKVYINGPLGPRLTPRGSFDEWRETVRGTSVPWSPEEVEMAQALRGELQRAQSARHAETARARDQMLAILGHDLRTPLQTISMAASLLDKGVDTANVGQRIRRSSSRMERLIKEVLDMSRLQSGLGLAVQRRPLDLSALLRDFAQDVAASHPGVELHVEVPPALRVEADADRLLQVLDNLVGNARQHGRPGTPIRIVARRGDAGAVEVTVGNRAEPISAEAETQLFSPFKRASLDNARNPGGMGLGLYIAREIARGHGGNLVYRFVAPEVTFTLEIPDGAVSSPP